ncbi:hypothetical protein F5J12DRAFT_849937 [Pisolithus orientalis]|uniref:uncharacterized protein n=1 Tax=Pisolithus orientalis TaxID=936130 RepID=UPI0022246D8B|nr:uncharacterized protein F5J12DRAFT_849937 [Pisolithus orientalis]KAI5998364.1 hypothetical protein F5J12DRAFT_849937 [Pisolithus orientalis]
MNSLPPAPITSLTPELVERLRGQALDVLSYLVKTNSATTYFKESNVLPQFRAALNLTDGGNQIDAQDYPVETFVASLVVGFLIMCLILYWLITVPSEVLPVEGAARRGQA